MNNCRVMGGEEIIAKNAVSFFLEIYSSSILQMLEKMKDLCAEKLCIKYTSLRINRNNGKIFFTLCKLYLIFATKTIKYI